jgi:nucleotide-binding universal stress UspA family protein
MAETDESAVPQRAVIVGAIPDQPTRVLKKPRYAKLFSAPLIVAHVDVTRFVYEDPDGYMHTAPIDIDLAIGEAQLSAVTSAAASVLDGSGVDWSVTQLVGDPALAIKHLAEKAQARLIVVGTRRRGFGESVREFFTGSVAARLAHRQSRPILVVPWKTRWTTTRTSGPRPNRRSARPRLSPRAATNSPSRHPLTRRNVAARRNDGGSAGTGGGGGSAERAREGGEGLIQRARQVVDGVGRELSAVRQMGAQIRPHGAAELGDDRLGPPHLLARRRPRLVHPDADAEARASSRSRSALSRSDCAEAARSARRLFIASRTLPRTSSAIRRTLSASPPRSPRARGRERPPRRVPPR